MEGVLGDLRLQWRIDGEHLMAVILRRLMRPDREGRKMKTGESSNLDMQSQFVVELDLGWVMEEKVKLEWRLGLEEFAGSMR